MRSAETNNRLELDLFVDLEPGVNHILRVVELDGLSIVFGEFFVSHGEW